MCNRIFSEILVKPKRKPEDHYRFKSQNIQLSGIGSACYVATFKYDNLAAFDDDIEGRVILFFHARQCKNTIWKQDIRKPG